MFIELTNMTKFYEVSKVLDKRTDAHGRVQFLVRWRGYRREYDFWVHEENTNEYLKQVFRTPFHFGFKRSSLRTPSTPSTLSFRLLFLQKLF